MTDSVEKLIDAIKVFINKAWQAADDTASGYTDEDGEKVVQTCEESFLEFSQAMEDLDNLLFEMSGSSIGWLAWRTKQALTAGLSLVPSEGVEVSQAAKDVLEERRQQLTREGWSHKHDDKYTEGELVRGAVSYALNAIGQPDYVEALELIDGHAKAHRQVLVPRHWPWSRRWWKPKDPRADLVRANALLVAEIERLDREAALPTPPEEG